MIIQSFAEHSGDLTEKSLTNPQIKQVAAVGLINMVGGLGAASPDLRASDADSYANFAASGGLAPGQSEPIGKRGSAGFNPVVVTN